MFLFSFLIAFNLFCCTTGKKYKTNRTFWSILEYGSNKMNSKIWSTYEKFQVNELSLIFQKFRELKNWMDISLVLINVPPATNSWTELRIGSGDGVGNVLFDHQVRSWRLKAGDDWKILVTIKGYLWQLLNVGPLLVPHSNV